MVMTALSEWNSHDNDFNKTAHLQFDTESFQQAGQLDVDLKMASQVECPCVFVHASLFIEMFMHVCLGTAGCSGHANHGTALFLASETDALFKLINMTQKEEDLNYTYLYIVHIHTVALSVYFIQYGVCVEIGQHAPLSTVGD